MDEILKPTIILFQCHLERIVPFEYSILVRAIEDLNKQYRPVTFQFSRMLEQSNKLLPDLQEYVENHLCKDKKPSNKIDYLSFCMEILGNSIYGNPRNRKPLSDRSKQLGFKFELDDWQYKMVKAVDQRKSVLVRAPTSSGKTFIAFYAIEKIVKRPKSVVVFVW